MKMLHPTVIEKVSGGMRWQGWNGSKNVIDLRGKDMGSWIDAANNCWKPGTPSITMHPNGIYIHPFRS